MSEPWLGRYVATEPIARDGSFHRHAARRASDGTRCVVVSVSALAERTAARRALERLAQAHAAVIHVAVPSVVSFDGAVVHEHEGTSFLELASEATIDGKAVLDRLIAARALLGFAEAEALIELLLGALGAALEAAGGPFHVGRLSLSSLLVDEAGRVQLLGLGHPVATTDEHGRVTSSQGVFEAPEVAAGASASVGADMIALVGLRRGLLPHLDLPPSLSQAMRGTGGQDDGLAEAVRALEASVASLSSAQRSGLAGAASALAAVRAKVGIDPDPEGLARLLSDLACGLPIESDWEPRVSDVTEESTVVAASGAWIVSAVQRGHRVELGPSLRRMLALLLARHREGSGRATTTWELLEAGWPGERLLPDAGTNRVYAAVKRLRNMGLRGVIERHDEGYRVAPLARLTEIAETE